MLSLPIIFMADLILHIPTGKNVMQENNSYKSVWKIESIDNPWEIVIIVNPKKYYEDFEDFRCNKKHKGIRKCAPGMSFENFAKRIVPVNKIEQQRFSVGGDEMQKTSITKTKFLQTNNKRFYSPNGKTYLPIRYLPLNKLTQYKEEKGEKIEKNTLNEKNNILQMEKETFFVELKVKSLSTNTKFQILFFGSTWRQKNLKINLAPTTQLYILNSGWI